MKKAIVLILAAMLLTGCGSIAKKAVISKQELLKELPEHSFKRFEYHRNGVYSNAHMTAEGGEKKDGEVTIKKLNMQLNYGPESLTISVEGYGADVKAAK